MNNIYISSSCVRSSSVPYAVEILASEGFSHIELSGGGAYEEGLLQKLLTLQARYNLTLSAHNYFPPPKDGDFVLNLASLDSEIFTRSVAQIESALRFSHALGCGHFGFHAGFFLPLVPSELGEPSGRQRLKIYDKRACIEQFIKGYKMIETLAEELGITLYIENNVLSIANAAHYGSKELAMLLSFGDFVELERRIACRLLLDVGHLQVSARTLGLDFQAELEQCLRVADYLHLSDNNALSDENAPLTKQSAFLDSIITSHHKDRIYTLEIYRPIREIRQSYELLQEGLAQ